MKIYSLSTILQLSENIYFAGVLVKCLTVKAVRKHRRIINTVVFAKHLKLSFDLIVVPYKMK